MIGIVVVGHAALEISLADTASSYHGIRTRRQRAQIQWSLATNDHPATLSKPAGVALAQPATYGLRPHHLSRHVVQTLATRPLIDQSLRTCGPLSLQVDFKCTGETLRRVFEVSAFERMLNEN